MEATEARGGVPGPGTESVSANLAEQPCCGDGFPMQNTTLHLSSSVVPCILRL